MASNHVAVAGAAGYLGRHLVKSLLAHENVRVTALVRPSRNSHPRDAVRHLSYSELDVTDQSAVSNLLSRIEPTHVINASSYGVKPSETDFERSVAVNTWGTFALLAGAAQAGVKRFTQIGSYFEYATLHGQISEETPLGPNSPYAATKAAASLLLNDRRLCGNMETVLARAFHLWGGQEAPHRLTSQIISACQSRKALDLTSGVQEKDFTYVIDAAKWISSLTLYGSPLPHRIYNIAGGKRCSVKEFALSLAAVSDGTDLLNFGAKELPEREPPSGLANISKLESLLAPLDMTPFPKALEQTLNATGHL